MCFGAGASSETARGRVLPMFLSFGLRAQSYTRRASAIGTLRDCRFFERPLGRVFASGQCGPLPVGLFQQISSFFCSSGAYTPTLLHEQISRRKFQFPWGNSLFCACLSRIFDQSGFWRRVLWLALFSGTDVGGGVDSWQRVSGPRVAGWKVVGRSGKRLPDCLAAERSVYLCLQSI